MFADVRLTLARFLAIALGWGWADSGKSFFDRELDHYGITVWNSDIAKG
jgi:hypothetical protein